MAENTAADLSFEKRVVARFRKIAANLTRNQKRLILILADAVILSGGLWLAMVLRLGSTTFLTPARMDGLYILLPFFGVAVLWFLGLYSTMIRSLSLQIARIIFLGAMLTALVLPAYAYFDTRIIIPRSVPVIYAMVTFFGIGLVRVAVRATFDYLILPSAVSQRVLIYGAGEMGQQVAGMINNMGNYRLVGFIDDDPSLHGIRIRGRPVFDSTKIENLKTRTGFDFVLLAMAKISPAQRRTIVAKLGGLGISIRTIPPLDEILRDNSAIAKLKDVHIEDLLGRDMVLPIKDLIADNLIGKNVLVTGAAGSIGSELCRQIIGAEPKTLIAFDNSEFGLYSLEKDLQSRFDLSQVPTRIKIRLGSVTNPVSVRETLKQFDIDIVYHAAAYKHVPIIEDNAVEAVRNNIFGTKIVCEEAASAEVERFVFISTDKAVRPTSVMGATKRVAELVVQDVQSRSTKTCLSMVRFGNVLGSSGSVIPLFRSQIESGGPITVTHPEVTRYFMTISEASQLVLQAGFLAEGGEVFVLDMGEPVKLVDVARLMIQLSGQTALEEGGDGDGIAIDMIGLRPGEKLYEELLIEENAEGTPHPKIMKAVEKDISSKQLKALLERLDACVKNVDNERAAQELMSEDR